MGVCCPSITCVSREARLSRASCISATSDPRLQKLGLQLYLGNIALQIDDNGYSILSNARKQYQFYHLLNLCIQKLKLNWHNTISPNMKITCRRSLSNPSLVLSYKVPGVDYSRIPPIIPLTSCLWYSTNCCKSMEIVKCHVKCLFCMQFHSAYIQQQTYWMDALTQLCYTYHQKVLSVLALYICWMSICSSIRWPT